MGKKRWLNVLVPDELYERIDKILLTVALKAGRPVHGLKTDIIIWALEEWLSKYENNPNLYDIIIKRLE